jgi:hypothetical protein
MIFLAAPVRMQSLAGGDETWNNFRLYFPVINLPQFMLGVSLGYALRAGIYTKPGPLPDRSRYPPLVVR